MIYLELFLEFLKIGTFSFGGGAAMLPMIEQSMQKTGWMTRTDLYNFVGISESTPGPIAINLSTYIGARIAGFPGALAASIGVVFPSFVIILLVARVYTQFQQNLYVRGVMEVLHPIVAGMLAAATLSVAANVFSVHLSSENLSAAAALIAAVILAWKKQHPILIICVCALVGIVLGAIMPQ